jgi:hypothetical protein
MPAPILVTESLDARETGVLRKIGGLAIGVSRETGVLRTIGGLVIGATKNPGFWVAGQQQCSLNLLPHRRANGALLQAFHQEFVGIVVLLQALFLLLGKLPIIANGAGQLSQHASQSIRSQSLLG